MKPILISLTALIAATLANGLDKASAQTCDSGTFDGAMDAQVVLPQNWDCDQRQAYWFTDQGSQIIPYVWFLHLETAEGSDKFAASANMDRLRYLPQKSTRLNPDGLPIGFTKGNAKGNEDYGSISERWLGMTCSACHTGQVEFGGQKFLIDGAPTMGDFEGLQRDLVKAMRATLENSAKFDRFADGVIADSRANGTNSKSELRNQLEAMTAIRSSWNQRNLNNADSGDYGHGRLDALGAIYNETAATALGVVPGNVKQANAPVSYPFVWDTPQHDKVQWNGSISNAKLGSLSRNVGEVLGVFGSLEIRRRGRLPIGPGHKTSVNVAALAKLETLLWKLQSPQWIDTNLPPINEELKEQGKLVFNRFCRDCHADIDRTDPDRRIKAKMIPAVNQHIPGDTQITRTDPIMAVNFLQRQAEARKLTRESTRYLHVLSKGDKFDKENQDAARQIKIVAYSVAGTIVNELIKNPKDVIDAVKASRPVGLRKEVGDDGDRLLKRIALLKIRAIREFLEKYGGRLADYENTTQSIACFPDGDLACYKARPLNGIWATGPYLHNGSVRTLRQLLLPSSMRDATFNVGSREFDENDVGFTNEGGFVLDTSKPGNSNAGHEGPLYGTDVLSSDEGMTNALLEYLKSL